MPVKQHHEYHPAVKIVRGREQRQRIAEGNFMQCKCSHIPMTVNQELLSNTRHGREKNGAITLTLIGPPRDIDNAAVSQAQQTAQQQFEPTAIS